jgi:hypothetical protein
VLFTVRGSISLRFNSSTDAENFHAAAIAGTLAAAIANETSYSSYVLPSEVGITSIGNESILDSDGTRHVNVVTASFNIALSGRGTTAAQESAKLVAQRLQTQAVAVDIVEAVVGTRYPNASKICCLSTEQQVLSTTHISDLNSIVNGTALTANEVDGRFCVAEGQWKTSPSELASVGQGNSYKYISITPNTLSMSVYLPGLVAKSMFNIDDEWAYQLSCTINAAQICVSSACHSLANGGYRATTILASCGDESCPVCFDVIERAGGKMLFLANTGNQCPLFQAVSPGVCSAKFQGTIAQLKGASSKLVSQGRSFSEQSIFGADGGQRTDCESGVSQTPTSDGDAASDSTGLIVGVVVPVLLLAAGLFHYNRGKQLKKSNAWKQRGFEVGSADKGLFSKCFKGKSSQPKGLGPPPAVQMNSLGDGQVNPAYGNKNPMSSAAERDEGEDFF